MSTQATPVDFARDFVDWVANSLIPQLATALHAPCLVADRYSIIDLLKQYETLSRTPPAIDRGSPNLCSGLEAIVDGFKRFAVECYADYGVYELRRSAICPGNGAVVIECLKILGGVERTVSVWAFVPKYAMKTPHKGFWDLVSKDLTETQ